MKKFKCRIILSCFSSVYLFLKKNVIHFPSGWVLLVVYNLKKKMKKENATLTFSFLATVFFLYMKGMLQYKDMLSTLYRTSIFLYIYICLMGKLYNKRFFFSFDICMHIVLHIIVDEKRAFVCSSSILKYLRG